MEVCDGSGGLSRARVATIDNRVNISAEFIEIPCNHNSRETHWLLRLVPPSRTVAYPVAPLPTSRLTMLRIAQHLTLAALLMDPRLAHAQRVVRESANVWRTASPVTLTIERRWCVDANTEGCDFKAITAAIAVRDSGVVLADFAGPIRRFAADGHVVAMLGRKGRGPGEYGFIVGLNQAANGLFAWFDNTQMRVATIALDGTAGPVTPLMPPHTMNGMWILGAELVVIDVPPSTTFGDTVLASYHTVPASGTPRVLARVRTPSVFEPNTDMQRMAGPFAPRVVSDVGPTGDVAHSNGGRYTIDVFPAQGAPWTLNVDMPLRAITSAEHDSARALVLKQFRVGNVASLPPLVRDIMSVAANRSTFAPLSTMRVLRDGTLWIRPVALAGASVARWDVFTRDGRRVGAASLPISARVLDGARDWVLVSELGNDDVPMVVRYRVAK